MEQELEFFDSNILIAGSVSSHVHHAPSFARLALFQQSGGACGAHSLAEAYSNLTHPTRGYNLSPADASVIINHAARTYTIVTLDAEESLAVLDHSARRGLQGPMIYDALLIACARKIGAKVIYTYNLKHFREIAPDLADLIREP